MSVEKFIVTKEDSGYTTLPNSVLQNIDNLEALGLWCYFQSKPPQWEFIKKEIRKIFNIGIHKLENLCTVLKNHNLIEIMQDRNNKGCFSTWRLHVKNGSDFVPLSKNCITEKTSRKHRSPENRATDNRATVNSTYKRKNVKKKDFKENKEKSSLDKTKAENEKKHDFAQSMNQMANEKKNIQQSDKFKKARMPDSLRSLCKSLKRSP